jgi:hypothetical protein
MSATPAGVLEPSGAARLFVTGPQRTAPHAAAASCQAWTHAASRPRSPMGVGQNAKISPTEPSI